MLSYGIWLEFKSPPHHYLDNQAILPWNGPMRIEPSREPVKLDKRTNLPFVLYEDCPECSSPFKADLSTVHYLSYPTANTDFDFGCYCNECDHEWERWLHLQVRLVLAVEYKDGYPINPVPDGACGLCGSLTCNGRCFK